MAIESDIVKTHEIYRTDFFLTENVSDSMAAKAWLMEQSEEQVQSLKNSIAKRAADGKFSHDFSDAITSISWDLNSQDSGSILLETNRDMTRGELQQVTQRVYSNAKKNLTPKFQAQEFAYCDGVTGETEAFDVVPTISSIIVSSGVNGQMFH